MVLWAGLLPACGADLRGVELPGSQCLDKIDNDLDTLIDCDDPDCWSVDCREPDAGTSDAGHDSGRDAGPIPDTCDPVCAQGETCIDDQCRIALPASLSIEVLSIDGPSRSSLFICLDGTTLGPGDTCNDLEVDLECEACLPDPFVEVAFERVPIGGGPAVRMSVGKTRPVNNSDTASWPNDATRWDENHNPLRIEPGDDITIDVRDYDDPNQRDPDADFIFGCVIHAEDLRMGPQRCVSRPNGAFQSSKREFEARFDVRAR